MRFLASEMDTPIGKIVIVCSELGVCRLLFGGWAEERETEMMKWVRRWYDRRCDAREKMEDRIEFLYAPDGLREVAKQLNQYFEGDRTAFELNLDLRGTPFQMRVWHALQTIPYGRTCSYKEIAAIIGQPRAVRAVGGANNRNPLPILIPCHRVIGTSGRLIGYGGGLQIKQQLLHLEKMLVV